MNTAIALPMPAQEATCDNRCIRCQILCIDKDGSLLLNVSHKSWDEEEIKSGRFLEIFLGGRDYIKAAYVIQPDKVAKGSLIAVKDESGWIKVLMKDENLSDAFSINLSDTIQIWF